MKRTAVAILLVSFLFLLAAFPAMALAFSGMVLDSTVYSLVVKQGEQVKIFQIRPETQGDKYPHPQDEVEVTYHEDKDSGAQVADFIHVTKRFQP